MQRRTIAATAVQAAEEFLGVTPGYSVLHHRRFIVTLETIMQVLPPSPAVRVADLGVWPGYQSYALQSAGYAVTGYDLLPDRLPRLPFSVRQQDFQRHPALDAEPSRFDAVVATEIIEHLDPTILPAFLSGIHRALRPGGVVFLTTPNRRYLGSWFRPRVHGTDAEGHGHTHEYIASELQTLFTADWTDVRVKTIDAYRGIGTISTQEYYRPLWHWWRHSRRLHNLMKLMMSGVQAVCPPWRDTLVVTARRTLDKKLLVG
jgi:SAM-dependent methyltransferase